MDGWSGRFMILVEIVSETPKRYRVKLLDNGRLPGRCRYGNTGDVILVPKSAVTIDKLSKD